MATLPAVTSAALPTAPVARLLALDTATDTLYLALQTPHQVLTHTGAGGAQASAALLPAIQNLLQTAGFALTDLQALACGVGPGAFTGLRTACSVVQGLAVGLGLPVLALPTLMAVAESARQQGAVGPVWALQDARMGEVYAARYEPTSQGWEASSPPQLLRPEPLMTLLAQTPASLAGNALRAHPALADRGLPCFPDAVPDGDALRVLAQAAWQRGEAADPALLLPLYVRDKVAQTTAERTAQGVTAA